MALISLVLSGAALPIGGLDGPGLPCRTGNRPSGAPDAAVTLA